jgi:hypothetical protein
METRIDKNILVRWYKRQNMRVTCTERRRKEEYSLREPHLSTAQSLVWSHIDSPSAFFVVFDLDHQRYFFVTLGKELEGREHESTKVKGSIRLSFVVLPAGVVGSACLRVWLENQSLLDDDRVGILNILGSAPLARWRAFVFRVHWFVFSVGESA